MKVSPYNGVMLILRLFSVNIKRKGKSLKIIITQYGEVKLIEIKFEIWRVTFFKSFLPLKIYGIDFRFSRNNEIIKCPYIGDVLLYLRIMQTLT